MNIIDIKNNKKYLEEYVTLCSKEWGTSRSDNEYIDNKINEILNGNKVISILGLIDNEELIGFISLFKYDGDERRDLTPWYATICVKEEYRGKGYSKLLSDSILEKARSLGYKKVYLKSYLNNYYVKFGAKYIETLNNGEKLFYIDL